MGVRLVHLDKGSELLAIDRNVEDEGEEHAAKTAEKGNAPTDPAEPDPNDPNADGSDGDGSSDAKDGE